MDDSPNHVQVHAKCGTIVHLLWCGLIKMESDVGIFCLPIYNVNIHDIIWYSVTLKKAI